MICSSVVKTRSKWGGLLGLCMFYSRLILIVVLHRIGDQAQSAADVVPKTDSRLPGCGGHRPQLLLEEWPGPVCPHSPLQTRAHVRNHKHTIWPYGLKLLSTVWMVSVLYRYLSSYVRTLNPIVSFQ